MRSPWQSLVWRFGAGGIFCEQETPSISSKPATTARRSGSGAYMNTDHGQKHLRGVKRQGRRSQAGWSGGRGCDVDLEMAVTRQGRAGCIRGRGPGPRWVWV